jgi:hypothetical protein
MTDTVEQGNKVAKLDANNGSRNVTKKLSISRCMQKTKSTLAHPHHEAFITSRTSTFLFVVILGIILLTAILFVLILLVLR